MIQYDGKVGIGETAPEVKLEVAGDILAKDSYISCGLGATDGYQFHDFGSGYGLRGMSGGVGSRISIYTNAVERFYIDVNGDTTFLKDVTINNGDAYNQLLITDATGASSNKQSGIMTLNYAGNNTSIFQTYCTSSGNTIYYGSADGNYRGITDHRFYVNAAVDATTGHTEALHIDGDTSATFAGAINTAGDITLDDGSGASPSVVFTNGSNDSGGISINSSGKIEIQTGGTVRQTISSGDTAFAGDVVISNATPAITLTDTDNSTDIVFSSVGGALVTNAASDQIFQIAGSEYFRVATSLATFATNLQSNGSSIKVIHSGNANFYATSTGSGYAGFYADASNGDFSGGDYFSIRQLNDLTVEFDARANAGVTKFYSKGQLNLTQDGKDSTFGGEVNINSYLKLYTTDDQAHRWYLYTHTDDSFRMNYNGSGGDEIIMDTSGNITFTGAITSGNITTYSRITFDYGGDHYLESGTDTWAFKNSGGATTLSLNFSTHAAAFTGKATSATTITGDGSQTLTTKNYVDGLIVGATIYQGTWDANNGAGGTPDLTTIYL